MITCILDKEEFDFVTERFNAESTAEEIQELKDSKAYYLRHKK